MSWIPFAISGASAVASLAGKKKRYHDPNIQPFHFNPNENDPELLLRRRKALEEISRDKSSTLDEISRAGLLGSSAAFGVLGESTNRGNRLLEDVNASSFDTQRKDALDLYKEQVAFERQKALMDYGYDINSDTTYGNAALDALGNSGDYLGGELEKYLKSLGLPNDAIQGALREANNNQPSSYLRPR